MTDVSSFQTAAKAYVAEEYEVAFPLLKKCAEGGHATACFLLALMYAAGQGVLPDRSAYQYWLTRLEELAKQGDALAQWELSCKYRWGNHFPNDVEAANYWLQEAAQNGNPDAQFHLSCYLKAGDFGFESSASKAAYWFEKAIEQRYPEALYSDAVSKLDANNGRLDSHILNLLKTAAASGFSPAQEILKRFVQ